LQGVDEEGYECADEGGNEGAGEGYEEGEKGT